MNKFDSILNQISIHIAEASVAAGLAAQDETLALTDKQKIALKALTRQLHLAQAAQWQAEGAGHEVAPIYGNAAKPISFSLRAAGKK